MLAVRRVSRITELMRFFEIVISVTPSPRLFKLRIGKVANANDTDQSFVLIISK